MPRRNGLGSDAITGGPKGAPVIYVLCILLKRAKRVRLECMSSVSRCSAWYTTRSARIYDGAVEAAACELSISDLSDDLIMLL